MYMSVFSVYLASVRSWWLETEIHLSQGSRLYKETCTVSIGNACLVLLILTGPAYKLLSGQADNPDDRWQQRGRSAPQTLSSTFYQPRDVATRGHNISFIPGCKRPTVDRKVEIERESSAERKPGMFPGKQRTKGKPCTLLVSSQARLSSPYALVLTLLVRQAARLPAT
ncbi:hypothetical protein PAMP_006639 [Pampus punctatissimus]